MPNAENLTDKIAAVIRGLDHGNANLFSEEGEVRISVIRDALNTPVTRDDIRATGLLRVIPAAPIEAEPVQAPQTVREAEVAVNDAQVALDQCRTRLINAEKNGVKTRAALATTIQAWCAEFPPVTFASEHAAHIKRLAAHAAAGRLEPQNVSTAGRSPLDQFAAATSAKGRGAGQGDAFRRGASSRRLPSQR